MSGFLCGLSGVIAAQLSLGMVSGWEWWYDMCFLDDGMADIPGLRGRNDDITIGMVNEMLVWSMFMLSTL